MNDPLLYVLIVAAIGIGWWLGSRDREQQRDADRRHLSREYFDGLNYLLHEQPDRAISTFIQALEVNSDTIETHLALGSLMRRRGEVDKAVTVHQNLLSKPEINRQTTLYVQLELARDYQLAGLFDRAERLLIDLMQESGEVRISAMKLLVEIYQQEREWQKAITVAGRLPDRVGDDWDVFRALAHLNCELAHQALVEDRPAEARSHLEQAFAHDPRCVRASLLKSDLELQAGRPKKAFKALARVVDQDPAFVPESLDPLLALYRDGHVTWSRLAQHLHDCLERSPSISVVLTLARCIREEEGDESSAKFLSDYLKRNPTIRGLTHLIDLHIDNMRGAAKENLAILRSFTQALVADKPTYRCEECGFSGKKLHWLCPSCKEWGTVKPIYGLEGE